MPIFATKLSVSLRVLEYHVKNKTDEQTSLHIVHAGRDNIYSLPFNFQSISYNPFRINQI